MTLKLDISTFTIPTTHGHGPFHPAIRNGYDVWYWPNITFPNEDDAYKCADESLQNAIAKLDEHTTQWNVYKGSVR